MHYRALAIVVTLFAAPLHAAEAEPEGEVAAASAVEITVIGSDEEFARLREVVAPADLQGAEIRWLRAERFDRDAFLSRSAPDTPADPALAVRAFVFLTPGRASLYFVDRSAERFLVREVSTPNGLDALGSDAVSQVLTLSIVALRENAGTALTRAETERLLAPEPAKPEPPPPVVNLVLPPLPKPSRSFVGASAFYAARVFGGGAPLEHGPGLRLAWIHETSKFQASVWASGQYALPSTYETAVVGVDWTTAVLRGGLALLFSPEHASRVRLGGALGAGADIVSFTARPGAEPADLELAPPGQSTPFALSPRLVANLELGEHFDASLELFCDVYPTRVRYFFTENAAPTDVLVPWRVRPGFSLALGLR
ncbi:MAG TPA: hypothetical protein VGK73_39725 [Polyangiaceae bacterium]